MMGKIWRLLLLALLLNGTLATVVLARSVYMADGGIIQAQRVWQKEGRVYLLLNRDSLISFSTAEVNLKKTFAAQSVKPVAQAKRAPVAAAVSPAPKAAPPVAVPVAKGTPSAAAKPVAVTAPTPAEKKPAVAAPAPAPPVAKNAPPAVAPAATKAAVPPAPKPAAKKAVKKAAAPAVSPPADSSSLAGLAVLGGVLVFLLVIIASIWKVFEKAGEAGWKSLIPLYNFYVMLQIAGCPAWWFFMFFIPVVNIYFMVVMYIRLAEKFGKSPLFGFALCFLGFIFFPILGFGSAMYGGDEEFTFEEV